MRDAGIVEYANRGNMDLTLPVSGGSLAVGIWQGIYLYEHRTHAHQRRVVVTVQGE